MFWRYVSHLQSNYSSPSPKSSSERSFNRTSADWNDSILKLSSPRLRYWSIYGFFSARNDWACWKSCADQNGCDRSHCSEYFWCLLCNPVALPYAFPHACSTPTPCLWAFVFIGLEVQVRSGCCRSIGSSLWVTSSGGPAGMLSMNGSWIDSLSMAIQVHLM